MKKIVIAISLILLGSSAFMIETAEPKSPVISWAASFWLPAGGQFYNGQYKKGLLVLGGELGGGLLAIAAGFSDQETLSRTGMTLAIGSWIYSWIDAPVSSVKINKKRTSLLYRIRFAENYKGLEIAKRF